ncbi:MAG: ABC transporter permease [Candidatus Thorarchaeota archaeon]|nr:ABC transporter permease [Candidatus Thorarchaeota archaeon]
MKQVDAGKNSHRAVVVLCFLLVTTTTTGILAFIDSSSLQVWTAALDTDPVAMVVNGNGVENEISDICQIDGVSAAEVLAGAQGHIRRGEDGIDNVTRAFAVSGVVYSPTAAFFDEFEPIFTLLDGKFPENESEVAIPKKVADIAFIGIGYQVNYSYTSLNIRTLLTVVGIYSQTILNVVDYYFDSIGIVHPSLLNPISSFARVFVNVDRTQVTPSNVFGALAYANRIERSIVDLYPGGVYNSQYRVDNYLAIGIKSYLSWRDSQRAAQLLRAGGIGLLILMVAFSGVQYFVREKKKKCTQLYSRGASQFRINLSLFREIVILSFVATLLGIFLGILTSRIAMASDGFLSLNLAKLTWEPLLFTADSLVIVIALGVLLPVLTFIGYKGLFTAKQHIAEEKGRTARLVKGMSLIRWDLLVVLVTAVMIGSFYMGGPAIQSNPILTVMLSVLQLPLFLGIASLGIKALSRGAEGASSLVKPLVGSIPAAIGVRTLGKGRYSMSIAAMALIMATCIMWNGAVIDATLPITRTNHARFAIGGDISFHLSDAHSTDWTAFADSLSAFGPGIAASIVTTGVLFLSGNAADKVEFVAINASEYVKIGYDYYGERLNESSLSEDLNQLRSEVAGVILTADLAKEYNLQVNDILRAFTAFYGESAIEFTVTSIVEALGKPTIPGSSLDEAKEGVAFGHRRMWVNLEYLRPQINPLMDTRTYSLCAANPQYNSTDLVEYAMEEWGPEILYSNRWASADYEVEKYLSQTEYIMDRAVDSMMVVVAAMGTIAAMVVFFVENLRENERYSALLRSMGATRASLVKNEIAQGLVLVVLSIAVLALYAPLYIANTLVASGTIYSAWEYIFPITVFVVVPWPVLISFLFAFVLEVMAAIVVITGTNGMSLRHQLRASWAESQPSGGSN